MDELSSLLAKLGVADPTQHEVASTILLDPEEDDENRSSAIMCMVDDFESLDDGAPLCSALEVGHVG